MIDKGSMVTNAAVVLDFRESFFWTIDYYLVCNKHVNNEVNID